MERFTQKRSIGDGYFVIGNTSAAVEKLAQFEDAEQDGRLIVLPCKVGDTLYETIFYKYGNFVNAFAVPDISWILENQERIGKTIFFTREEAESAFLKEESDNA